LQQQSKSDERRKLHCFCDFRRERAKLVTTGQLVDAAKEQLRRLNT
jgi:hypothetical protein